MEYQDTDYASIFNVAIIKPKFAIDVDDVAKKHNVVITRIRKNVYQINGSFYDTIAYVNEVGNPLNNELRTGIDIYYPQYRELFA